MRVRFSTTDCKTCPSKPRCTRAARRILTPRPREEHETLVAARTRSDEPALIAGCRRRAGVEGTLSRGVRAMGLRRARYVGLAKTHLQHFLTATAINLMRLAAWVQGTPPAQTRRSAFIRLMSGPAAPA